MEAMKQLSKCIEQRHTELEKMKDRGAKVVGILGFGYTPEEMILAAGAIPQRLIRGGDRESLDDSREYCHNCFSTFHKAQIGYLMKGKDPVYNLIDHLVLESGDEHSELTGMYVYAYKPMPMTWLGIPGNPEYSGAFPYYLSSLEKFKKELEKLTGNQVSQQKLEEYAKLYNDIRDLLGRISDLRKAPSPPISGLDYVKLNHASFYCDPHEYLALLKQVYEELKLRTGVYTKDTPRIAVFGCPIAVGDYRLLELIEDAGAAVVTEEITGSTRDCKTMTSIDGNLMENLARRYYSKKSKDVYKYPWGEELLSVYSGLVDDFKVDGVIWYQLMYMEAQSMLGYVVNKRLKQRGIPAMTIQSEYDFTSRIEAVKTRIETFIEVVKQSKSKKGDQNG
jgi:benzoyl-CoA reductase/2-hydroxyglutaryl-CoA dehydratase subunit BcrC/BadD/HgdB